MFLDLNSHNYDNEIIPFITNGIIIDTSVIKIIIDGLISTRISKKKLNELFDYKKLLDFFDLIKVNNRWNKFFITPHILTEVCTHLRNNYNKHINYKEIVKEILPLLESMEERMVEKNKIIDCVDFKNPVIEIGDISILIVAENFISTSKRVAILSNDDRLNGIYRDNKNIMIMDYKSIILNRL